MSRSAGTSPVSLAPAQIDPVSSDLKSDKMGVDSLKRKLLISCDVEEATDDLGAHSIGRHAPTRLVSGAGTRGGWRGRRHDAGDPRGRSGHRYSNSRR